MRDASSVITQAVKGITGDLAEEYELSEARMYELLGKDCTYPKTKKLIRSIAHCDDSKDKWRVRLIKADLDAMFEKILSDADDQISAADIHKETSELVQSVLTNQPRAVITKEARDVISVSQQLIEQLEEKDSVRVDYMERAAIDSRV